MPSLDRTHRAPSAALPRHSADCHMHALDAGELLDVLAEAVPDASARRAILADNPARLYGFER